MREQLNNNPMVQMGVIAVLLVAAAIFLLTTMGGGGEEEGEAGSSSIATTAPGEGVAPSPGEAPPPEATSAAGNPTLATQPLPQPVLDAWNANQIVVLLIVHDGGIDDDLVKLAGSRLAGMPGVTTFTVPAGEIARYASITQGVGVDRVPALVVLRPKKLDQAVPTASVSYGFQDGQSIEQAVIDAGYKGPTLEYHP
ncbi:MAG TPA: hypothetical protein VFY75_09145 [Solirubrobacterales bacterium]|nr:hypothetical protein [Solirubrobacterales bacterium]